MHGTVSHYRHMLCRCDECRAANAASEARYRRRKAKRLLNSQPSDLEHGTLDGYNNWMCRCESCRDAKAQANAEYKWRVRHGAGV